MDKGRYILYGTLPSDHPDDNRDVNPDRQQSVQLVEVYDTNDHDEAKALKQAGGFDRNGQWVVVTGGKDTETGGTMGEVPA